MINTRQITDKLSSHDVKNTLVMFYSIAMIVYNVTYMKFTSKGNSNSRNKYAFEVENIQLGGKPL